MAREDAYLFAEEAPNVGALGAVPEVNDDEALARFLVRVRDALDVLTGADGGLGRRAVTFDDLFLSGIGGTGSNGNLAPGSGIGGIDLTPPPAPSNVTTAGGFGQIIVTANDGNMPTYTQGRGHGGMRIYAAERPVGQPVPGRGDAKLVGYWPGVVASVPSPVLGQDRHFWVSFVTKDGIEGSEFGGVSGVVGATGKIGNVDLGPLIVEAANLASGAVSAAKLAAEAVDMTKFAAGIRPPRVVSSLPALPNAAYANGDTVVLTTDGKLYRLVSGAWTAATAAADMLGQIVNTQISDNAISTPKLQAGSITVSKLAVVPPSLCPSPFFEDEAWWTATLLNASGWYFEPGSQGTPKQAAIWSGISGPSTARFHLWSGKVASPPVGTALRLRIRAASSLNQNCSVVARFRNAANADVGDIVASIPAGLGGPVDRTFQGVVPTNAATVEFIIYNDGGTPLFGSCVVAGVSLDVAASADLIVDGAVTADKVAANAIIAGKIAAGAVGADQIVANAIRTDKLLVTGRGAALNDDPATSDVSAWPAVSPAGFGGPLGNGLSLGTSAGGSAEGPTFFRSETSGPFNQIVFSRPFPINPNRTYSATAMLYADPGNNRNMYIIVDLFDGFGARVGTTWGGTYSGYTFGGTPPTGDWTRQGGQFGANTGRPIPNSAKTACIGVWFQYDQTGSGRVVQAAQAIRCEEATGADLIVDGAIVANKIAAEAVVAGKLAANSVAAANLIAGSVVADKIAAGAVTAGKIAAGAVAAAEIAAGVITADKFVTGLMSADNVLTRGLTVRDNAGGVILSAGVPLPVANASPNLRNENVPPTNASVIQNPHAWTIGPWIPGNGAITATGITDRFGGALAARLSLTAGSFDLYRTISGLRAGATYRVNIWYQRETAANFCVTLNNSLAWNTGGLAVGTDSGWALLSTTITLAGSSAINVHLGAHSNSGAQQSAGTVLVSHIELLDVSAVENALNPSGGGNLLRNPLWMGGNLDSWSAAAPAPTLPGSNIYSSVGLAGGIYALNSPIGVQGAYLQTVAGPDGSTVEAYSEMLPSAAGRWYQFSLHVNQHRSWVQLRLVFFDGPGNVIAVSPQYVPGASIPTSNAPSYARNVGSGNDGVLQDINRTTRLWTTMQAPAGTARMRADILMGKPSGVDDNYVFMAQAMLCEVAPNTTQAVSFDAGPGIWQGAQRLTSGNIGVYMASATIDLARINTASITNLRALSAQVGTFENIGPDGRLIIQDARLTVRNASNQDRVYLGDL